MWIPTKSGIAALAGARASLPAKGSLRSQVFADWKSALQLTFRTVLLALQSAETLYQCREI